MAELGKIPKDKEADLVLEAMAELKVDRPLLRARVVGDRVELWFLGGESAVIWMSGKFGAVLCSNAAVPAVPPAAARAKAKKVKPA